MQPSGNFLWLAGFRPTLQAAILLLLAFATTLWSVYARGQYEPAVGGPEGTVYFVMVIAAWIVLPPVLLTGAIIGVLEWRGVLSRPSLSRITAESITASGLAALLVHAMSNLPGTVRGLVLTSWLAILLSSVFAYGITRRMSKLLTRHHPQ